MKIGFKALAISANAQLEEDEEGEKEEIGGWVWGLTIALLAGCSRSGSSSSSRSASPA